MVCNPNHHPKISHNLILKVGSVPGSRIYNIILLHKHNPNPKKQNKCASITSHLPQYLTQTHKNFTPIHHATVILGGGTTAYSAIEAIRQLSPSSPILVLSSERVVPSLHRGDMYRNNEASDKGLGDDLLSSYNEWRRHITSKLSSEPDAIQVSGERHTTTTQHNLQPQLTLCRAPRYTSSFARTRRRYPPTARP